MRTAQESTRESKQAPRPAPEPHAVTPKQAKRRQPKVSKAQTLSARRQADRDRRAQRRAGAMRKHELRRQYKFRVKVVRLDRQLRAQVSVQRASELTLAHYQPTTSGDFPLCASSIRQWHRLAEQAGFGALRPQSTRPHTIHHQVPEVVVGIIFTLRRLFGWGGHRIAAELKAWEIGQVSGQTVYHIFARWGLPVKGSALQGRADGIAYQRYEKSRANIQWHMDLKHTTWSDGRPVYSCILMDDYARYALAAGAGASATTAWVAQIAQATIQRCGRPEQIVSDNGREFGSVWEDSRPKFGQLLAESGVAHVKCAPHYPQGNGKAEAFIKTLDREVLAGHTFGTLQELQGALDRYLTYYNNYRLHSALGWQPPVSRYTGQAMTIKGLAGIPGLEPMATDPKYAPSYCDPPVEINARTAGKARALEIWQEPVSVAG